MDGCERRSDPRKLTHGSFHRLRHVVQFAVDERVLAAFRQQVDDADEVAGQDQLEPHLVEGDGVPKRVDQRRGTREIGGVEGEDQAILGRNGLRLDPAHALEGLHDTRETTALRR